MTDQLPNTLKGVISITRHLVEKMWPEEREVFELTLGRLNHWPQRWQNVPPDEWRAEDLLGEASSEGFCSPGIIPREAPPWARFEVVVASVAEHFKRLGNLPKETDIEATYKEFGTHAQLSAKVLEIAGPTVVELVQSHLLTNRIGWQANGLTIVKAPPEKIAMVPPKWDIVEIGLRENRPYILINQQPPKKQLSEGIFAALVLLLAARRKGRKVNKLEDLLLPDYPRREQLLTDVRDFLMYCLETVLHKMEVDRGSILPSDRKGNVELHVFEKKGIVIKRSICAFESQHIQGAEREIQQVLRTLKAVEELPSPWDSPVFVGVFQPFKEQSSLTFRHTRMVMKAAQIMGWKFQDRNVEWWQRWQRLVSTIRELLERVHYSENRIAQEFYLPQRGHQ